MPVTLSENEARTVKNRFLMGMRANEKKLKRPFDRALKLYVGEHWPNMSTASTSARVICNYVLHVVETRTCSAAFRYPRFVITPTTQTGEGQEPIIQAALKYYWRVGEIQDELRRSKKDAEIYGLGVVYEGWKFETDEGVVIDDGSGDGISKKTVRADRFFAKRIFPGNFVVSPECGRRLDDAQWCGYWEIVPLDEVKKNQHFKNVRQIEGSTVYLKNFLPDYDKKDQNEWPSDVKRVKLFHYFEKKRQIHVIMCEEHDKPLYAEEWPLPNGRYPFRYLQGPGDEDNFYGQSMALMIEHPQKEINEARSQLSNHRKMANPKYQTGPATMTDKTKTQIKSSDPYVVVEHNSETPGAIVPIEPLQVQTEIFKTEEASLSDIQRLSAVSQYEMGNAPTKRTPTAEVNQISGQGGARSQNDVQAFERLCADVAVDCIAWLKKFAVKTRELKIYPKGVNTGFWMEFTRDEIKGEYDVEVAANSTAPPNDADTLQSIGFFIQSVNPLLQMIQPAQMVGVNLLPLLRQVLKALPDIEDVDEIVQGINPQMPGQPGMGPAGMGPGGGPAPAPAAVMGPAGGAPFAQPAAAPVPPDLLAALMAGGNGA